MRQSELTDFFTILTYSYYNATVPSYFYNVPKRITLTKPIVIPDKWVFFKMEVVIE